MAKDCIKIANGVHYLRTLETVPCQLCGLQTTMTGTKRCDRCWELERRIHADPEIAKRILSTLKGTNAEN